MSTLAGDPPDRHKSVLALLEAHPREKDAKILIRNLAREKIAYAKAQGWNGPAFCPKIFAGLFGIRCKEVNHDIGGEGRILPYEDGKLWIEYRGQRLPERQRFTMFHEFAHTLFPDFCKFVPHHYSGTKPKDPEREFENLCDIAASEMLLPAENFNEDIAGIVRICVEEINRLSSRYQASIDATIHRFIDLLNVVPCAAVFLTDQKGSHPGHGPLWTKYSLRSSLFKGYIQPGVIPPNGSVALHCYKNRNAFTVAAKETWWVNGSPRSWLVQAAKLPEVPGSPEYSKVVALLLPSGYN